jgi:hypothetical protein
MWKGGGQKPAPPKHLSAKAKRIWQEIVNDRPADWFRPGSLLLLEQLCCTMVGQRDVLVQLERDPCNTNLMKVAKDYATIINATATKLRLTVQNDVHRDSRKIDEREPGSDPLLGSVSWGESA